jgi:hypothetical protein
MRFSTALVFRARAKATAANVHLVSGLCFAYEGLCVNNRRLRERAIVEAGLRCFIKTGRLPDALCGIGNVWNLPAVEADHESNVDENARAEITS